MLYAFAPIKQASNDHFKIKYKTSIDSPNIQLQEQTSFDQMSTQFCRNCLLIIVFGAGKYWVNDFMEILQITSEQVELYTIN